MISCTFEDGGKANLRHVVVHAIAVKEGKVLLVKRAPSIIEGGKWGFPGGFLDQNETLEECVIRELFEETGYQGKVRTLFRINSGMRKNDGERNNVAHEFIVDVGDKTGEPDWEQTDVKWFEISEIDLENLAFDHSKTVLEYKRYLESQFPLPIMA